jgi:hypothetical protein
MQGKTDFKESLQNCAELSDISKKNNESNKDLRILRVMLKTHVKRKDERETLIQFDENEIEFSQKRVESERKINLINYIKRINN